MFAGTGALGIEALSRGASSLVFVEKSSAVAAAIRKNLADLEAINATVHQHDALDYLKKADPQPFDVVFLDPPFDLDVLEKVCDLLEDKGWLSANAIIYLEQDRNREKPALPDGWASSHEKVAGKVSYSLVRTGIET